MPTAAKTPCRHPGCPALTEGTRYCEAHRKETRQRFDRKRGSAASRGYDADWKRLRLAKLSADPFCECEDCKRRSVPLLAEVVDHIETIEARPDLRLAWSNLRSMAKVCHDRHTAKTQGFGRKRLNP